jgi:hypothetical protein
VSFTPLNIPLFCFSCYIVLGKSVRQYGLDFLFLKLFDHAANGLTKSTNFWCRVKGLGIRLFSFFGMNIVLEFGLIW